MATKKIKQLKEQTDKVKHIVKKMERKKLHRNKQKH